MKNSSCLFAFITECFDCNRLRFTIVNKCLIRILMLPEVKIAIVGIFRDQVKMVDTILINCVGNSKEEILLSQVRLAEFIIRGSQVMINR